MPIYDYHCDHCGHTFSAVQSYADATLEVCPSCGKKPRKLMATPAIVFKGGGWYKTDSRVTPKEGAADGAKAGGENDHKDPKAAPVPATDAGKADGPKTDGAKADGPKTEAPKTARTDKTAPTAPKGEASS